MVLRRINNTNERTSWADPQWKNRAKSKMKRNVEKNEKKNEKNKKIKKTKLFEKEK